MVFIQEINQIHGFVMISKICVLHQLTIRFVLIAIPIVIICDVGHWMAHKMESRGLNWIVG
jgi:hypothetical protein